VPGGFGGLESGVVGELSGWILLPGVPGVPGCSGGVELSGAGVLPGVPEVPEVPGCSGGVELSGAGVLDPDGGTVPGCGVKLLGAGGSGGGTLPGAGVPLGVLDPAGGTLPGAGAPSGVVLGGVSAGTVVLGVDAVPPGQRELSGKYSHRIFIPSGDILISVGAVVESLVDWAMGDLLD